MTLISSIWRSRSQKRLGEHLCEKYSGILLDNDAVIRAGIFGDFECVWRLKVSHKVLHTLLFGVSDKFPFEIPSVLVEEPSALYLKIPHVEEDGRVCVFPSVASCDIAHIEDVADEVIAKAIETIEDGISGVNKGDFIREIESYWKSTSNIRSHPIWFIGRPTAPSRTLFGISLGGFSVFGDSAMEVCKWVENLRGDRQTKTVVKRGFFLHTTDTIYPDSFFRSNEDFLRYVEIHHSQQLTQISSLLTRATKKIDGIVALATSNGTALLGTSLQNLTVKNDRNYLPSPSMQRFQGFRDGKVPPFVFARRFGKEPCIRSVVHRAYPEWIHTRGGGLGMSLLDSKSATLIGGGSLGSEVAQMLCNAGLGNLTILDFDVLSLDNIGRHLLGAREVGKNKAIAIRDHLRGQFPHCNIEAVKMKWQDYLDERGVELFFKTDLIISLTGEWPSDASLNMEIRSREAPPTIFGWTEPHGCAGHALLIATRGGCLACGRNTFGEVNHRVTNWSSSQMRSVPACGGFYQPYGAVETGPIKSMIASLALECLQKRPLTSQLRTWLGSAERIKELGGQVSQEWLPHFANSAVIGQTIVSPWPANIHCPQCTSK
jgi:hypothetical protein